MKIKGLLAIAFLFVAAHLSAQNALSEFLAKQTCIDVKVQKVKGPLFKEAYLLMIDQPLDYKHPEKGTFKQRLWLSHFDENAPMVMVTEGYSAHRNYTTELAEMIGANQIIVEHRYFEVSTPKNLEWKYLTVENAANDHHRIVQIFKQFYKSKWINTGISKGGTTVYFHRAFFPDDVDISVPYVAPLNFEREDQRLFDFFHSVGNPADRQKLKDFQRLVLSKRNELLPMLKEMADKSKMKFSFGLEKAFELSVLEYPFAFLQWGKDLAEIPTASASKEMIFNHLMDGSDISYFSDESRNDIKSFYYQAYTELGYYGYVPGDLKPLFKVLDKDTISSSLLFDGGDTLKFRKETMHYVVNQLRAKNPQMIILVGENDPWGSTSLQVADLSNSVYILNPEGSHLTRIANLPPYLKNRVYANLEKWLGKPLRTRF
jgi:hypothetical protein